MGRKAQRQTLVEEPIGVETLTGTVSKLLRDKGFGFIKATDGREYFFHHSAAPDFDAIDEQDAVQFVPGASPKGPRAEQVQLAR